MMKNAMDRAFFFLAPMLLCFAISSQSYAVATKPVTAPWMRANDALNHMRLDPNGRFLAFVKNDGLGLSILDLKNQNIFNASERQVGGAFFWSPDGYRLFFRELTLNKDGQTVSALKAYDCVLHKSVLLDHLAFPTGLLTFDPRDLRLHFMTGQGIMTRKIYFPDERLARWQAAQRTEEGKWLATQNGILWLTDGGLAMRRLDDDQTPVESFDISADGSAMAWATMGGRLYISQNGKPSRFIGYGRDPAWHPKKTQLLFSGARMVGNKAVGYDLRLADLNGAGRFLTVTQFSDERWPQWYAGGKKIVYTISKTTDVYLLDFKK